MRLLVTGGTGGLGVNVCKLLLQTGYKVRILVRPTRRNLKTIKKIENSVELCWGDITHHESIQRALDQIDMVVHMAAVLPPKALQLPELAKRVNAGGTNTLVEAIKQRQDMIPIIYTSSVAVFGPTPDAWEPLSSGRNRPQPMDIYADTKLQSENIIKQSGLDFVILRLTATPYLTFKMKDLKKMFAIPLYNRVEICHPEDIALAIGNAVKNFPAINGKTLIISGGCCQRMLYTDMIGGILGALGLPLPPEKDFAKDPYCLDWYDTGESESLLHYQSHNFADYLQDLTKRLSQRYGRLFVPLMRRFVSPVFGKAISRILRLLYSQ
jgi:UDP-glucose 4-epimerase